MGSGCFSTTNRGSLNFFASQNHNINGSQLICMTTTPTPENIIIQPPQNTDKTGEQSQPTVKNNIASVTLNPISTQPRPRFQYIMRVHFHLYILHLCIGISLCAIYTQFISQKGSSASVRTSLNSPRSELMGVYSRCQVNRQSA